MGCSPWGHKESDTTEGVNKTLMRAALGTGGGSLAMIVPKTAYS